MKKPDDKPRFRTHISEPRWQQVVSVVVVLAILAIEGWVVFHH